MKLSLLLIGLFPILVFAQEVDIHNTRINGDFQLPNTVPPLDYEDDYEFRTNSRSYIPVVDNSFVEHERGNILVDEARKIKELFNERQAQLLESNYAERITGRINSIQTIKSTTWVGTDHGLYRISSDGEVRKHERYGVDGPLSTKITGLAKDSKNSLWVGTSVGLSVFTNDGIWESIRGSEGLPVEDITALTITKNDELWIGTSEGAILYKPYSQDRKWYYRAGKRYLVNDEILDVLVSDSQSSIYFNTKSGLSKIDILERTLSEKAGTMEKNVELLHRRMGLVAACELNDPENPTSHFIPDSPNDGLWTSYHVVAMSLAYGTTGDKAYLASAKKGMDALIMLQNASGIPGVLARSVLPAEELPNKKTGWKLTQDGKMIWRDDASSDEVDGHFFAFYAYWEHIAKHDPKEADLIKRQISILMNYIVDNNYQLLDWNGERTKWGFWNPEELNSNPEAYLENGLNAAQILSFLKVTYYITGNQKFKQHYDKLIVDHGYMGNILLEKKAFPDKNNHSDNQLGYCALYPLLQLEHDPRARVALQQAVRRHHRILRRDGSSFFYFAAATIDLDYVEIIDAIEFLRQMPTDRRQWKMTNSNRKDIIWHPYNDRFNKRQLLDVLPADERNFDRWNKNPYYPDGGKGGKYVDGEASWLLAYWMGRYHGFIAATD